MLSAHKRRWPSFIFSLLLVLGVVTPILFADNNYLRYLGLTPRAGVETDCR